MARIGEVVAKILYITAIVCPVVTVVCAIAAPFVKVTDVPLKPAETAIVLGKTFAMATADEKNAVSHRGRALRKLLDKIKL